MKMTGTVKNLKIILACDDPTGTAEITDIIKGLGISEIRHAKSIFEGMKTAIDAAADIMICFYNPEYDYLEFFESIQGNPGALLPPILFVFDKADETEIAAIMELGADDFIEKSLCGHLLFLKLLSLAHARNRKEELRNEKKRVKDAKALLLKNFKNFKELTAILLKILEIRIPGASDRAEKAKTVAEYLTEKLGMEEEKRRKIVFAAVLHELGKVGLPDGIAGKDYKELSPEELAVYKQYTTVGSMIISTMTGFKESADAVYHQLENHDGSGFPGGLMGDQIPIGAKILRAVALLEHLANQGLSPQETADNIRHFMNRTLDRRIANLVIEFVLDKGQKADCTRIKVPLDKLKTGMVIAEDVYAASGIKLLPKGMKVQEKMIEVIMERNSMDPIIGGIYIEC
jgi:response regulator RpfG family c-di-GMP phosphodiesterase